MRARQRRLESGVLPAEPAGDAAEPGGSTARPLPSPLPAHGLGACELPNGAVLLVFDLDCRSEASAWEQLSGAQARVVKLALEGLGDVAIAERLGLSRHTVSNHLRRVYAQLGVSSRFELSALLGGRAAEVD